VYVGEQENLINAFLDENMSVRDLLLFFLRKADKAMQQAVLELYVRK
jgi:hypothetical protein